MKPSRHAHLEADVLLEVVVEAAADLDGLDDRGEVVVGEDHRRGFLRDLGAGDPHRDPDVGPLQRRRVVHAVAGHRDDVALALERVDEPDLVLGRDARDDADAVDLRRRASSSLIAANSAPVIARPSIPSWLGDRLGGHRVVARDHAHLDPGRLGRRRSPPWPAGRGGSTMPTRASSVSSVDQREQVARSGRTSRVEVLARRSPARAGPARRAARSRRGSARRNVVVDLGDAARSGPSVRRAAREQLVGRALDEAAHDLARPTRPSSGGTSPSACSRSRTAARRRAGSARASRRRRARPSPRARRARPRSGRRSSRRPSTTASEASTIGSRNCSSGTSGSPATCLIVPSVE